MLYSSTPAARKILIHNETLKSAELARRAANVRGGRPSLYTTC